MILLPSCSMIHDHSDRFLCFWFDMKTCIVCQTFMTLSLSDMASRVQLSGPREAEKYILNMVSSVHSVH